MADRRVQVERELLKIGGELNDLKKKAAALSKKGMSLTEAELKLLQKKRLEERSLKKEQAKYYKEQEENLQRQSGLTSKLEQLQDKIGKIYKRDKKLVVETNAEFYKSGLRGSNGIDFQYFKTIANKSEQDKFDVAASLQKATDVIVKEKIDYYLEKYPYKHLCLSRPLCEMVLESSYTVVSATRI